MLLFRYQNRLFDAELAEELYDAALLSSARSNFNSFQNRYENMEYAIFEWPGQNSKLPQSPTSSTKHFKMKETDNNPSIGHRIEPGLGHPFSHWSNYPQVKKDKALSSASDISLYENEELKTWLLQNLPCFHLGKLFWATISMKTFVNSIHSFHKLISGSFENSIDSELLSKSKKDSGSLERDQIPYPAEDNSRFFKLLEIDICSFSSRYSKGVCYSWGTNNQGQLGSIGLAQEGLPLYSQHKKHVTYHPRLLLPLKNCIITAVACGHSHSLAVTVDR